MAVNVECGGDVLVAKPFLRHLYVNALPQHDTGAKMPEVMKSALWQICFILQLCEHLTQVFRINRLAIGVNDDIIRHHVGFSHAQPVQLAGALMPFQLFHKLRWNIDRPLAGFRFWVFYNGFSIYNDSIAYNMYLILLPVHITPLQAKQLSTAQP